MGSVLYRKRASRRSLSKHSGKKKKKNSSHYKSATWLPANVSHVWPPVVEQRTRSLRRPYAEISGRKESGGAAACRRNGAVTRACRARPAGEPSTYVLLLIILTYMLPIMSQTSFPQAYSLLAIYVSTALPWRAPPPRNAGPPPLPTPFNLPSLRWMFCPPFAFCSALMSQGHM